jgi:small subunit ribosomal protein S6
MHKAHYVLMNIECGTGTLEELGSAFRFNDAVLRHMFINRKEAVTEPSPLMKKPEERRERSVRGDDDVAEPAEEEDEAEAEDAGAEGGA